MTGTHTGVTVTARPSRHGAWTRLGWAPALFTFSVAPRRRRRARTSVHVFPSEHWDGRFLCAQLRSGSGSRTPRGSLPAAPTLALAGSLLPRKRDRDPRPEHFDGL